jgi:hypothetical protein
MSESMAAFPPSYNAPSCASRVPEAMRVAREILANPNVSPDVKAIAASVIRRHGLPLKLDS